VDYYDTPYQLSRVLFGLFGHAAKATCLDMQVSFLYIEPKPIGGTGDKVAKGGHQNETDEFFNVDNGRLGGNRTFDLGNARRVGGYARGMETNREYGDEQAA
jgi:hypothetical protein